ncbi:dimethylaniline monooxygenase [N-oxide-forming] 5 isoform X1 [Lingula anatina]|uniref:Flavin-containing monooxygenase n=1 Tax=Lingula anatina TaxID=7574 RepID=A0A1S3I1K2_LINAN|nr:dimethylaniline monooxygenase [N-oxide-forming] 5 isoform X1 [Lingula anatina]|eukprot:XP_013392145.1 dimethylaniline monooxygenase [N-oxide-forming] 5 isoform X1 [Lingula anatina]
MCDRERRRVAVIGAGASGLTSIKACLEEDLDPVCYEQCEDIGGLWTFTEEPKPYQGGAVYDCLVTNTSKEMTCFSDYPFPKHFPMYLTHRLVKQYLDEYAKRFGLLQHISFNTKVLEVEPAQDYNSTGSWTVTVQNGQGEVTTDTFDDIILASGFFWKAWYPDIPGKKEFTGRIMHAKHYRRPEEFRDKTVLVVGNSNSAGDIAVDVSRVAEKTFLSIGNGTWIMNKVNQGQPADFQLRRFLSKMPSWLTKRIAKIIAQSHLDHTAFGLQPEVLDEGPLALTSAVMFCDELPLSLATGKVAVKPHLIRLEGNKAMFEDGTCVDRIDVVIFATGYNHSYSFVDKVSVALKNFDLYKLVFPTDLPHPSLAVVGCVTTAGPVFPVVELQARWATRVMAGRCVLPSAEVMKRDVQVMQKKYVKTDRSSPKMKKVNNLVLRDDIAELLGVGTCFWRQIWTDPVLAFKCYFGPCFPYQHRLCGPHTWEGARDAIFSAWENTYFSLRSGLKSPNQERKYQKETFIFLLLLVAIIMLAWFVNMVEKEQFP